MKLFKAIFVAAINFLPIKFALAILAGENSDSSGPTKINIKNPIGPDTLIEFVEAILGIIIQIGIPVLVVMIVYVGFKFVMAQGNDGKLTEAKTAFFWTIIGAAIVLGAFVISTVIQTTINNLGA